MLNCSDDPVLKREMRRNRSCEWYILAVSDGDMLNCSEDPTLKRELRRNRSREWYILAVRDGDMLNCCEDLMPVSYTHLTLPTKVNV